MVRTRYGVSVRARVRAGAGLAALVRPVRPWPYRCHKRRFFLESFENAKIAEKTHDTTRRIFGLFILVQFLCSWQISILLQDYFHVRKHPESRNLKIAANKISRGGPWNPPPPHTHTQVWLHHLCRPASGPVRG